jgi:deoxyribodipyrimidine photo-lyase
LKQAGQAPAIVWFRQDLRLADHAALAAAMAGGGPVLPVYVLDDEDAGAWAMGGASRWWLHGSLLSLQAALAERGAPLVLRRGRAADVLPALLAETGASRIDAGRMHEPWARTTEAAVERAAPGALHLHRTSTLFDLDGIRSKTGGIYGVYGPFARQLRERGDPSDPLPAPRRIPSVTVGSERLQDWNLLPTRPDWAGGFRDTWQPGEHAAHERLAAFVLEAVLGYDVGRNLPGQPRTSMLSAHLHWGEISPGQVWRAVRDSANQDQQAKGIDVFLGELLWREFAAYLLWHNPHLPEQPLRPRFAALPGRRAPDELRAWQRGQTGVPIVDAGMRQLWHIGWMHNRVRMIAASFLVKHLLMPWRAGEDWFWDTLVDADLASNATSWQWIAGSGIDSQPFFRVFNPVTQGQKFDPAGDFVRRWVPELASLPDRYVHAPWTAPVAALREAGLELGTTYPRPVIDLAAGRQRALAAYRDTMRTADPAQEAAE